MAPWLYAMLWGLGALAVGLAVVAIIGVVTRDRSRCTGAGRGAAHDKHGGRGRHPPQQPRGEQGKRTDRIDSTERCGGRLQNLAHRSRTAFEIPTPESEERPSDHPSRS